ncbi:hypothetical protein M6B38_286330 [Iris pallida]|uniref:Uncharacterized protein n=1 Tax=Iris pallida TaxID=29817 RepID=A0AAX6EEP7_IRIPA|nr:hypothetical protein M6B38_193305 [Iris pallida]KAJ6845726.1 hypothetical protein M6B38_286330 [Iris pallida]
MKFFQASINFQSYPKISFQNLKSLLPNSKFPESLLPNLTKPRLPISLIRLELHPMASTSSKQARRDRHGISLSPLHFCSYYTRVRHHDASSERVDDSQRHVFTLTSSILGPSRSTHTGI